MEPAGRLAKKPQHFGPRRDRMIAVVESRQAKAKTSGRTAGQGSLTCGVAQAGRTPGIDVVPSNQGTATMSRLPLIRLAGLVVVLGLAALTAQGARGDYSSEQLKADEKLFDDAKLPHTDGDLLSFFRKRLVSPKDQQRIEELIQKLSSKSFKEREQV